MSAAIDKLVALAEAGPDCLYAPRLGMTGLSTKEDVVSLVKAVAPKPANVLAMGPGLSVAEHEDMRVRRISVGGVLAQVAWPAVLKPADEMKTGSVNGLSSNVSGPDIASSRDKSIRPCPDPQRANWYATPSWNKWGNSLLVTWLFNSPQRVRN